MIPESTRSVVMFRAGRNCENCGERRRLELHHLRYTTEPTNYEPCGMPINGLETPNDLLALCRECHHRRHVDADGVFWRDPEELAARNMAFEEASDK